MLRRPHGVYTWELNVRGDTGAALVNTDGSPTVSGNVEVTGTAPAVTGTTPTLSTTTPLVGSVITANPGGWGPDGAGVVLTYQWYRDDVTAIYRRNRCDLHRPEADDLGETLSVRGHRLGDRATSR